MGIYFNPTSAITEFEKSEIDIGSLTQNIIRENSENNIFIFANVIRFDVPFNNVPFIGNIGELDAFIQMQNQGRLLIEGLYLVPSAKVQEYVGISGDQLKKSIV